MPVFDLNEVRSQLESYFAGQSQVLVAYLFGSQALGRSGPLSDLDVAVLLSDTPTADECFDARLEIIGGLMDRLHTDEIDVLVLNQAPPVLCYQVLRTGQVVYYRDRQAMLNFRVRTLNTYFDLKPMLDHYRKVFFDHILEGTWLDGYNRYRGKVTSDPLFAVAPARDPKS